MNDTRHKATNPPYGGGQLILRATLSPRFSRDGNIFVVDCMPLSSVLKSLTSGSAVAKRPRDASCLSVVSFNSAKRRLESFTVSYVGYRFITAVGLV